MSKLHLIIIKLVGYPINVRSFETDMVIVSTNSQLNVENISSCSLLEIVSILCDHLLYSNLYLYFMELLLLICLLARCRGNHL